MTTPRISIRLLFAWVVAGAACERNGDSTPPSEPVACTREAKLCPDGTAVGRVGPNCEFEACPPAADPCAGKELPPCPPTCAADAMQACGTPCTEEGAACGNEIGDGQVCQGGVWQCSVHAPLGQGCNLVCRPAQGS